MNITLNCCHHHCHHASCEDLPEKYVDDLLTQPIDNNERNYRAYSAKDILVPSYRLTIARVAREASY